MTGKSQVFSMEQLKEKPGKTSLSDEVKETEILLTNADTLPGELKDKSDVNEQVCIIHIFRSFQVSITKPLIPLRIALFLWYGAAPSPVAYLSVFMKQKGLSLVEYSSIFSATFVFQFLTAFFSGIVADKIGNAKPVLIYHIILTILMILALLLIPGVNICDNFPKDNTSMYNVLNISNISGQNEDLRKTFPFFLVNEGHFNETNIFNYKKFTNHSLQNASEFASRDKEDDFIAMNAENFPIECESHKRIFLILHIIVTLIYFSSWSAVYRFMDVTVISMVQKFNTSFGYERFFSMAGNVVVTSFTGIVLNSFTSEGEENNYRSIYWFSFSITCLVLVAVISIKSQIKLPSRNVWKKGFSFIRNVHVLVFLTVIFSLGTFDCFFNNFTLWFLEHLNASTMIMGLQQTMNGLYGLPFYLISKWWLRVFNTEVLFIGAYFGYIIYGTGYSFLYEPWWCLLIESASALTYHVLWVAVIVHCHRIAPEDLVSTVIATAGAVHFGIGRSAGVSIGGFMMNAVGPRITFRIFAGVSSTAIVLYASYLYFRDSKETR